ncbi:MAG: tryptophan--tRNA ligase [Patescibacteria group bacterium]|nr:tryptophan--tRNA ligase [Patescibacteria group bacterium]MDD4611030.1 tryptophan--tRNA ligase [Patescibacteria group bacterium]
MKPTIFSGVQPSGNLHIGNYLGAISQWVVMQEKNNCIFCVVDYHAITVKQNPEELKKRILEIAKIYIASGIDPKKSVIFKQSDITAHTELAWILNCAAARMSDLEKMTQYKDKSGILKKNEKLINHITAELLKKINISCKQHENKRYLPTETFISEKQLNEAAHDVINKVNEDALKNISVGLFDYPVLMAADILLYNTDAVPVGDDQSQHVELCRTLAERFNHQFGETFKIPALVVRKEGARIMGLNDPTKKMSKSATSVANYIALNDDPKVAAKKIMRATTDSESVIKFDKENKPGISNLLTIYSLLTAKSVKELEKHYEGKGYGNFKKDLAEIVAEFLKKFQANYNEISDAEVKKIMEKGADKIRPIAEETIKKVKERIGVI